MKAQPSGPKALKWLNALVPGIITAAVVFGPSKMTITSKMGASYGTSLLWIVVVAIALMAIYTGMAARIGRASKLSFLGLVRQKWGQPVTMFIGVGIFLVTTSFQAGNAIGAGVAMAELTHTSTTAWVILFSLLAIAMLFFRSFYKLLEKVMISIVLLMLFSFVTTLVLSRPSLAILLEGLKPSIPDGSMPLVIAFVASCFSLVGALYQSYLVQERAKSLKMQDNRKVEDRSLPGVLLLGVMSACVMICAATVLHTRGIAIVSAADMGKSLEPLFGSFSTILFLVGLLGAAISSLIGNATLGGTLLGDALGKGYSMNDAGIKMYIAAVMLIGGIIAICFGKLPLELIVFAQSITIFVVPTIGVALFSVANDRQIMGDLVNSGSTKFFAAIGLLVVFCLAAIHLQQLIFN